MNSEPTLSLCMIVRDEERFLPQCLESVMGTVDEIVVVDTGSRDATVGIAESFGARVVHHPWENDFSKHRNQSVGYARGDWVLWLDADEALEPGGGNRIRQSIRHDDRDSFLMTMVCYFGNRSRQSWNNTLKLFKNHAGIHFEGTVHNQVVGCAHSGYCPVKIYHYGYDVDQQTVKRKFERTSSLLKQAITDHPDDFRHHHDLAVSYSSMHMHRKAVGEGLRAIELYKRNHETDPNILWTHFVVASSYFNLGLIQEAGETACAAIRMDPNHLDSYFVLASVCAAERDRKGFEEAYGRFGYLTRRLQEHPELLRGLVVNKMAEQWRLDLDYGAVLLQEEDEKGAHACFTKGMEETPDKQIAYRIIIQTCRDAHLYPLAESYLEKAMLEGMPAPNALFEKAMIRKAAGLHGEYVSLMQRLLLSREMDDPALMASVGTAAVRLARYKEAEDLLSRAVEQGYQDPSVLTGLALACKYQGKTAEAEMWNHRAFQADPTDIRACVNLGHLHYDEKQWNQAKAWYEKALEINEKQRDVLFRLSLMALMENDLQGCVRYCDRLGEALGVPLDMEIGTLRDLSLVYRTIGEAFLAAGIRSLHHEAKKFAQALRLADHTHPSSSAQSGVA